MANLLLPPIVKFVTNVSSGYAPLAVKFTDQSTGSPTQWNWNFGDGNTSTDQNPQHTYPTAGTYNVGLL
jgi:PKD repeat protein